MEVSELRLGNYIQDESGYMEQVESLNSYGVGHINEDTAIGGYEPILLNAEWLLIFGFQASGTSWLIVIENIVFDVQLSEEKYYLNSEGLPFSLGFKYVHQLQNLFFAITGKELTIQSSGRS
jgi:hypothetical protein